MFWVIAATIALSRGWAPAAHGTSAGGRLLSRLSSVSAALGAMAPATASAATMGAYSTLAAWRRSGRLTSSSRASPSCSQARPAHLTDARVPLQARRQDRKRREGARHREATGSSPPSHQLQQVAASGVCLSYDCSRLGRACLPCRWRGEGCRPSVAPSTAEQLRAPGS